MPSTSALLLLAALIAPVQADPVTEPRTNIPIVTENEAEMFPPSWRPEPINAQSVAIASAEKDRSVKIALFAMAKYPVGVLKKHLKKVYFSKEIKFYGLAYGGTNSLDTVYLTNNGVSMGYSDLYIESAFHHEFSSILLRNERDKFPTNSFTAANPKGFKYRGDGTQSLREGTASTRFSAEYHEQGFLAQYSTSSIEEDFNMFAEALFTGHSGFWAVYDKYPNVKKKAKIMIDFYGKLDPVFTESYFRSQATKSPTAGRRS